MKGKTPRGSGEQGLALKGGHRNPVGLQVLVSKGFGCLVLMITEEGGCQEGKRPAAGEGNMRLNPEGQVDAM